MRCLLFLLLAGCASLAPSHAPKSGPAPQTQLPYRWENTLGPNTREQLDLDSAQCERSALDATAARNERGRQIFGLCMRGRGWRLVDR